MTELINLITVGVAVVCIVLAVGSRDRMRTLEFRIALIERRIRDGRAESTATPPAAPDLEPESSIVPESPPPQVVSEPVSPDAAPPLPPTEPASPPPVDAASPSPSL